MDYRKKNSLFDVKKGGAYIGGNAKKNDNKEDIIKKEIIKEETIKEEIIKEDTIKENIPQ